MVLANMNLILLDRKFAIAKPFMVNELQKSLAISRFCQEDSHQIKKKRRGRRLRRQTLWLFGKMPVRRRKKQLWRRLSRHGRRMGGLPPGAVSGFRSGRKKLRKQSDRNKLWRWSFSLAKWARAKLHGKTSPQYQTFGTALAAVVPRSAKWPIWIWCRRNMDRIGIMKVLMWSIFWRTSLQRAKSSMHLMASSGAEESYWLGRPWYQDLRRLQKIQTKRSRFSSAEFNPTEKFLPQKGCAIEMISKNSFI